MPAKRTENKKGGDEIIMSGAIKKAVQKSEMKFTPTVLAADENKEFCWLGKLLFKGLFDGEQEFYN